MTNNDTSATTENNIDVHSTSLPHASSMQSKGAELPPAVRIALTGQYLIEASAGTGKTWTLTGIVLRLLIEGKRLPEHIIATTFTRAAAADIRKRIHERLEHFHEALLWLSKIQADTSTHATLYPQFKHINVQTTNSKNDKDTDAKDIKISAEQRQARLEWLEEQAHLSGSTEIVTEPINSHLIEYLLDHAREYPLADAIRRCKLVLITLDKLFVGTLDSLSQKWLSEYSAETGYQQGVQISDNEQVVIESIIHDAVRAHHSHLYYKQPKIYELMQHTGRLTTPADHIYVAQKSLQFISTPIEEVNLGEPIDFAGYQQALTDFIDCDLTDIAPYFDKDYRKAQGMTWNAGLATKAERIGRIQTAIQKNGHLFFVHLDDETQKFYDALPLAFLTKEEGGKGFNKNKEVERQTFIHLPSIQALKAVHDFTSQIEQHLDALIDTLNRDIALQVRQKLPAVLEQRRETTFSLQMVRLNQALTGKQGERLARYIRHHYPIALIDESQDINGEQARMIERIYLTKSANKRQNDSQENKKSREFLLLVGDPKQAIYGFRGGDVANYNAMKTLFDAKQRMSLNINRRSNERLITALNHWFGRPSPVDDSQLKRSTQSAADHLAQLGKGIYYQHITAFKTDVSLSWQQPIAQELSSQTAAIIPNQPVSVIHLPANKDAKHNDCELTALHIAALLASGQTLEGRALKPSDIGVLGRRKKDLKQVEDMLSKLGVPTLETAERNVFDTPIASDLAALLEVMIRPQRRDIMNRVLTSHFYQLSLDDVQLLMLSADDDELDAQLLAQSSSAHSEQIALKRRYQDFQNYIKTAARQWQNNGILSALHYLFSHNPMNKKGQTNKNIWVALAEIEDGARHLMDLRHLLDILAQHGMHIGEHELLAWYKKNMNSSRTPEWAQQQPLPTESGVQLMTIHKSKGLEFPVVYVIGMDSASPKAGARSKHNLFLYDHTQQQKTQRRLSTSKGIAASQSANGEATKESTEDYYAQFETDESYEEMRRLAYVAFTRASEQLYMVLGDVSKNQDDDRKPCAQWLNGSGKSLELPERLQDYIGWLAYDSVESNAHAVIKASKEQLTTLEPKSETTTLINYDEAYAQIQARYFKGWAKTSFTALSRQLGKQTQALAIFDDSVEDDLDITDGMTLSTRVMSAQDNIGKYANENNAGSITSDNIRFRFVKGANAGTFLHEVFEKINFTDNQKWSAIIDQSVRHYQLPLVYTSRAHQQRLQQRVQSQAQSMSDTDIDVTEDSLPSEHDELITWISDVLTAPLLASAQPLQSIAPGQRIAELGFNMGLSEHFEPERINEVFKQYLPLDADKHIEMSAQYSSHIYRYLRGEIDLVYEHAGKYYVVDYKSNYLGNSLSDYSEESLSRAMSKAGYWLQAAIYQVALHRFLRLRINNYNGREEQYLGAVEYVFLRGIDSQGVDDYGRIKWQIPFALVQALDEMFGSPSSSI